LLIRHRQTANVWRPLIKLSRRRHLRLRKRLLTLDAGGEVRATQFVRSGV